MPKYKPRPLEQRLRNNAKKLAKYHSADEDQKEERAAKRAATHIANKERISSERRARRLANQEAAREQDRLRYERDKARINERASKYAAANRERINAIQAKYDATHREQKRIREQNRRALKRASGGKLSKDIVKTLMILQHGKCAFCRARLAKTGVHLDHIMPLALGGRNDDSNAQLLCPTCNLRKNAKHPIDFARSIGLLI